MDDVKEKAWWIFAAVNLVLQLIGLVVFVHVMIHKTAPKRARRALCVAVSSGIIFFFILDPFHWRESRYPLPASLRDNIGSLPFYYSFMLSQFIGDFLDVAFNSVMGTLLGVFWMVFMNYLMPGGAGPYAQDPEAIENAWLPGGYNFYVAYFIIASLVYCIFLSRISVSFKQYALGFLAGAFVEYVNPQQPIEAYKAVLWSYNFEVNWNGQVMGLIFIVVVSVPLAGLSIPAFLHKKVRRFFSCGVQASNGLAVVARDTMATLDRFVLYFCDPDFEFDNDSTYLYINNLGLRRSDYEKLMDQAAWEAMCYAPARARLVRLRRLVSLLRKLRQVLRVQIAHLSSGGNSKGCAAEILPLLSWFRTNCNEAVSRIASCEDMSAEECEEMLNGVESNAKHADRALVVALRQLAKKNAGTFVDEELSNDIVFIDNLRTCCQILDDYVKECRSEQECVKHEFFESDSESEGNRFSVLCERFRKRFCACLLYTQEEYLDALRNLTSWLLALTWSIYRGYSSTCVSAVSFVFSPTLGSLFDKNLNRMIGVGLGLVMGNFPAGIAFIPGTTTYYRSPQGAIVYASMAVSSWILGVYGALASRTNVGRNWGYACLLWAAFGGVQTLSYVKPGAVSNDEAALAASFNTTMDNFLACMIVFGVDIAFSNLFGRRVTDEVTNALPPCLTDLGTVITRARRGIFDPSDLEVLQKSIGHSRYCDAEVQKMDLVWNSLRAAPYKDGLVQTVLDKMDTAYVAAWALHASAERCDRPETVIGILRERLPATLPADCSRYAAELRSVLAEREKSNNDDVLDWFHMFRKPDVLQRQRETPDCFASADEVLSLTAHAAGDGSGQGAARAAAARALRAQAAKLSAVVRQTHVLLAEHSLWVARETHEFERGDSASYESEEDGSAGSSEV
eukprot:TRINITY_DN14299_c0_g1_i1.p1 TRINITY_DN14299_c0_g1~~TRINITY_DN14299_c0_g1_i1.p1  ORF type:complete len:946 (-),score=171.25 TRINITY_DN14299_c0_g1_i1:139-2859(-)